MANLRESQRGLGLGEWLSRESERYLRVRHYMQACLMAYLF